MIKRKVKSWLWFLLILGIFILSAIAINFDFSYFWSRRSHFSDIITQMFPPAWEFKSKIIQPLAVTIQMSVTGTAMGSLLALIVAPFCSKTTGFNPVIRTVLRIIIQILRSFPALILALAATFIFGIGQFAGTVALTLFTFAIMTRLTYEDAESAPQKPYLALISFGSGRYKTFYRATLPEILPSFLTNALYLLETNVRHSAILGYVGAGGIGLLLKEKISWREYDKVGLILISLFIAVCIIEYTSHSLAKIVRKEIIISKTIEKSIITVLILVFLVCTLTIGGPDFSHTSHAVIRSMLRGIIHPDISFMLDFSKSGLPWLILETICISIIGTVLGAILALPLSFLNTAKIVSKPISLLFRLLIMIIRSIPFLIYGIIFIRMSGPGAFTGALTMAVCSVGLLSKRFTQSIDSLDYRADHALASMGTSKAARIRYAIWPQLWPNFASSAMYRFDVNIREASILGIVGAGGIGAPLIQSMNHYDWSTSGAITIALIVLVWIIDILSTKLRSLLA